MDKDITKPNVIKITKKKENLLFSEGDLTNAKDLLTKMLIQIFIDREVTHEDFIRLHKTYMQGLNSNPKQISYHRNNLLKALLQKHNYSYRLFETVLRDILKVNLIKMSCTFMDMDSIKTEYIASGLTF